MVCSGMGQHMRHLVFVLSVLALGWRVVTAAQVPASCAQSAARRGVAAISVISGAVSGRRQRGAGSA